MAADSDKPESQPSEREVITLSTSPYDTASSADMKLSRSVSKAMFDGLAGVFGQDAVQALAQIQDFAGLDLDVGGLAWAPPEGW